MAEFFSTAIWAQRVRELEGFSKRDSNDLEQVATLVSHAEKRSQWLQRQYRAQQERSANSRYRLGLARCNLVGARMREYVVDWVKNHDRSTSSLQELELNLALLLGELLEVVELLLKQSDAPPDGVVGEPPTGCSEQPRETVVGTDSTHGT